MANCLVVVGMFHPAQKWWTDWQAKTAVPSGSRGEKPRNTSAGVETFTHLQRRLSLPRKLRLLQPFTVTPKQLFTPKSTQTTSLPNPEHANTVLHLKHMHSHPLLKWFISKRRTLYMLTLSLIWRVWPHRVAWHACMPPTWAGQPLNSRSLLPLYKG